MDFARMIKYYKDFVLDGQTNTRSKLAKHFGISEAQVYRFESLMKLIKPLQKYADYEGIPYTDLSKASVLSDEEQFDLAERLDLYFAELQEDEPVISRARLQAMIDEIKNGESIKHKKTEEKSNGKSCDKKVLTAVKSLEKLAVKKSLVMDNPEEIIAELKKLDKIINQLRLKAEDSMK